VPDSYRLFGIELSPYSVKVRSYLRYKTIPHEWIVRDQNTMPEYQKYAKIPIVPLLVTPDQKGVQDSTPIMEMLEARYPDPSIHPDDPTAAFVSALLEEFGDEWGNKWMFHYRWAREVDQRSAADRLVSAMMPGLAGAQKEEMVAGLIQRMLGRVWFVGSSEQTAPQIEDSFGESVELLETHLGSRPYLFGGRPAFGDFGLWGQIYNAWTDPTPHAILEERAPAVVAWVHRMLEPKSEGPFESWSALEPTLKPFLGRQVGRLFAPWTLANAACLAAGDEEFSVELDGRTWTQKPQKYHAKSLAALREKYAPVSDRSELVNLMEETGCLAALRPD
jgi:glutathione S-transferase